MKHCDEGDIIRNTAALVFNMRLQAGASIFEYLEIGTQDLEDIVRITSGTRTMIAWPAT